MTEQEQKHISDVAEIAGAEDKHIATGPAEKEYTDDYKAPVSEDEDEEIAEEDCDGDEDEDEDEDDDENDMSLVEHLTELRTRIIHSLIAIGIGTGICYYFIDDIMHCITMPAGKLYFMHPAEAFFTYLKIAAFAGFLLALPVVFYEIWKFVLPALTMRERTIIGLVVPVSVVLFVAGLAFSFFLVMPVALNFFLGFGSSDLQPMFSLDRYFSFVISFILPFGFVFEIPLAIIIFAKLGFISSKFLKKQRRMVIFMSFVLGAIITPTPDIFTQSMIALPMILLFEISYFIVRYILRK